MIILSITVILFFGFIFTGVPLFFATGLVSVFYFIFAGGFPLEIILQRIEVTSESFPLLAVPFFVLAGYLMMAGGAGKRIVKLSNSFVSWLPGGLAIVSIVAAMIFAGMSGSLVADAAAVGSIMIPGMVKKGYHKNYASAVIASSGSIGVIIPPSIPFILFGFIAGVSVGNLFIAGVIPGILIGIFLMIAAGILAKVRGYPVERRAHLREIIRALIECFPSLGMPLIILGGIFGGIFTATEAASVAVVYGLILGFFIHRELKISDLPSILIESVITSATILIVIGVVGALTWGLAANEIPQKLVMTVLSFTKNRFLVLLLVNVVLLILGCVMGLAPALLMTTPLLLPLITALGIHPLHLGLIIVTNLAIGSFTPPVGGALYVASGIAGISIWETAKGLIPFYIANIIVLILVTYFPIITLWLPKIIGVIP